MSESRTVRFLARANLSTEPREIRHNDEFLIPKLFIVNKLGNLFTPPW